MSLALPVAAAFVLALLLGGRLRRLAELELRSAWLFFAALGLQVVAFPFAFLPWRTGDLAGRAIWLSSYGLLLLAAVLNRRLPGVRIMALGMALNLAAIVANGGHMPVTASAMRAAGESYAVQNNSAALAHPALPWLVDRFAAPRWVPLANVFSAGDVLIALGAVTIVLLGSGARLPRPRLRLRPARS